MVFQAQVVMGVNASWGAFWTSFREGVYNSSLTDINETYSGNAVSTIYHTWMDAGPDGTTSLEMDNSGTFVNSLTERLDGNVMLPNVYVAPDGKVTYPAGWGNGNNFNHGANQGGDYFQVNRGLAPSNFNFQPSFGVNWQAAGIKNVSILLYPEEEPVIFNLEVGLPTKSKYLGKTISRSEAQLASSKSYLQAMHMVNEEYSSGTISPISIPSHVASWMQFFLNQNLGGWHLATVTNILGTNPGAPVKFADYTLKQ